MLDGSVSDDIWWNNGFLTVCKTMKDQFLQMQAPTTMILNPQATELRFLGMTSQGKAASKLLVCYHPFRERESYEKHLIVQIHYLWYMDMAFLEHPKWNWDEWLHSRKLTWSLKMDGWKMKTSFWDGLFAGVLWFVLGSLPSFCCFAILVIELLLRMHIFWRIWSSKCILDK